MTPCHRISLHSALVRHFAGHFEKNLRSPRSCARVDFSGDFPHSPFLINSSSRAWAKRKFASFLHSRPVTPVVISLSKQKNVESVRSFFSPKSRTRPNYHHHERGTVRHAHERPLPHRGPHPGLPRGALRLQVHQPHGGRAHDARVHQGGLTFQLNSF